MKIGAAVARQGDLTKALQKVVPAALEPLGTEAAHLGVLTVTNHFEDEVEKTVSAIRQTTGVQTLIGCTAEGVIGPTEEVEGQPAVALWLASLPDVRVRGFHLHPNDLEAVETGAELRRLMRAPDGEEDLYFLLLADPFFTPHIIALLDAMYKVFPNRPVFGGMASGADRQGQAVVVHDDDLFREGAVGVVLSGNINVSAVVSQGCRPVGKPFVITAAARNAIKTLGGRPALAVLNELFETASPAERKLMQAGVFIGRAITEYRDEFRQGDFLIRNVLGADKATNEIYMADMARVGTTVQFHVRDGESADADLRELLGRQASTPDLRLARPEGAMIFSCNGRGTRLFSQANHDLGVVQAILGPVPAAGLFCAGEIGPVGEQSFVHSHTASIALFREGRGAA